MILAVLLIHAVLLPVLIYGTLTVVKNGQEEVFVDHVRTYSRVFADLIESGSTIATEADIVANLDSWILGGRCVHAALRLDDRLILSSLMDVGDGEKFLEDFRFGEHDDGVYYLSVPLKIGQQLAVLEMGFDEEPTALEFKAVRNSIIEIALGYLLITVALVTILSKLISRPLQRLRRDSRDIAKGDYGRKLQVDSQIVEIHELTRDLDHMRSALVGTNARLQAEVTSREHAEAERRKAETHVRHMHRLQSIGTLAGGVAHEFNNVLQPIVLYTDLALEDLPGSSPVRPNLERVMKLANRAKGLSEQILTFSRPGGDALTTITDIAPVIDEAMSMVRALVPASVDILLDIERPVGPMLCNPNEVQQLLVNLCSNAYRALRGGGDSIKVSLRQYVVTAEFAKIHPRLKAGSYAMLQVADNGAGMDADTVQRIFDPFFTTREVGKGTGLGLSVVHGIVVRHGGDIVVSSEPGIGTTIDVSFPLAGGDNGQTENEND